MTVGENVVTMKRIFLPTRLGYASTGFIPNGGRVEVQT